MNILEKDTHEAKILVIENGEEAGGFAGKMIRQVKGPLFLPAAGPSAGMLCTEGPGYDISGFVPLTEALENRTLSEAEITAVLIRTGNAILLLEAHLLGDENLLLSPDRIYVRPDAMEPVFCPSLSADESFEERMRPLVRELFLHADAEEPQTLKLASELLKVSLRKHYRMHDLLKIVENGTTADRSPAEEIVPAPTGKYRPLAKAVTATVLNEEDLFAQWPEEDTQKKNQGFLAEIKKYAAAAIAWVRGDDEMDSTDLITFEDHT